jgi:ribosomal protein L11 methyltransferase
MPWISLIVETPAGEAERLSDAFLALGAVSVSVTDADAGTPDEHPMFGEPGELVARSWDRSVVSALCKVDADCDALLAAAAEQAGLAGAPAYRTERVDDADWVRVTQAQFEPIRVAERLWVVPSWSTPPDPDAATIILDPGLAFGTGSHPTTRLCIEWLAHRVSAGARVLDYGCGSGILAIAAMKLGAAAALGVDIDPDAVTAARANAARNEAAARFQDTLATLDMNADLVVANILANPLKVLAPLLAAHTRRGGRIALAGLLTPQVDDVSDAYAPWFDMAPFGARDGWTVLEGVRR